MSPLKPRTTRSSARFLASTHSSTTATLISIKRHSINLTDYEDYSKAELNSEPTHTSKIPSRVAFLKSKPKPEASKPEFVLTRSASITKSTPKAISKAPKVSKKSQKPIATPLNSRRVTRSTTFTISQKSPDESFIALGTELKQPDTPPKITTTKSTATKSSASIPKAPLKPVPKAKKTVSVDSSIKTLRITRSATVAASKDIRVAKSTKRTKNTKITTTSRTTKNTTTTNTIVTPNHHKKLGNNKRSPQVSVVPTAPVSARTRSRDIVSVHRNKGKRNVV
ncbi:hypothetical protein BZA77DRAFT_291645 [Pyronema omphalodes]|nr:hypothetical protein BZA77DRAFT_291645 [Pyronema omphalodes]